MESASSTASSTFVCWSIASVLSFGAGGIFPEIQREIEWVSRDDDFETTGFEPRGYLSARVAPDGRRIASAVDYRPTGGVWVRVPARAVTQAVERSAPVAWAFFGPGDDDVTDQTTLGTGATQVVRIGDSRASREIELPGDDGNLIPAEWSPDRQHLVGVSLAPARLGLVIWSEADGWRPLPNSSDQSEVLPSISPDGRWIAYTRIGDSLSERRIFVRPFLRDDPMIQGADRRGIAAVWSADGSELFYIGDAPPDESDDEARTVQEMYAVSFSATDDEVTLGRTARLRCDTQSSSERRA